MLTSERARELLQPLAALLGADGYELTASVEGHALAVTVKAGPDACADCLVPPAVFEQILRDALERGAVHDMPMDVRYPST